MNPTRLQIASKPEIMKTESPSSAVTDKEHLIQTSKTPGRVPQHGERKRISKYQQAVLCLCLILSCAGIYWSFGTVSPTLDQESRLNAELTRLNDSVTSMEFRISKEEQAAFDEAYDQAMGRLFSDDQALAVWSERIRQKAAELGIRLTLESAPPRTRQIAETAIEILPVTLQSAFPSLQEKHSASHYHKILQFHQYLLQMDHHTHIDSIEVRGGLHAIEEVITTLELWTRKGIL